MQLIWLGVLVLMVVLEAITTSLVTIWFIPGALVSLILSIVGVSLYIQIACFVVLSILLLALSRTIWKKYITVRPVEPTNADAVVGQTAIVVTNIDNIRAVGEVKVFGQIWSARSDNGNPIERDAIVKVLRIDGVKLICEKTE